MRSHEIAVIGAGIAGASAAYELQALGSTILLERESLPGQHTTGRSAAFLVESYGSRVVQLLTRGGRRFLEDPSLEFSTHPILTPRPVLWIAREDQRIRLAERMQRAVEAGTRLREVGTAEAESRCPSLRAGYVAAGVIEEAAMSIDVAGLLESYLRGFRGRGGVVTTRFPVTALRPTGDGWEVRAGDEVVNARYVVNAAGAWAERIGELAGAHSVGLQPLLRTAITFDPPAGAAIRNWPCVIDADEDFYVKPEGAQLLASPCDETPSEPCDAQPTDESVALAAERVQRAMNIDLRHIHRRWAGLRSFVADRTPVIGMAPECPGFYWLVGQGGFGIMTSSGAARTIAGLIENGDLPADLKALGLAPEMLAPDRPALLATDSPGRRQPC